MRLPAREPVPFRFETYSFSNMRVAGTIVVRLELSWFMISLST